jgi:hypothetical protein
MDRAGRTGRADRCSPFVIPAKAGIHEGCLRTGKTGKTGKAGRSLYVRHSRESGNP